MPSTIKEADAMHTFRSVLFCKNTKHNLVCLACKGRNIYGMGSIKIQYIFFGVYKNSCNDMERTGVNTYIIYGQHSVRTHSHRIIV